MKKIIILLILLNNFCFATRYNSATDSLAALLKSDTLSAIGRTGVLLYYASSYEVTDTALLRKYTVESLKLSEKIHYKKGIALAIRQLGTIYLSRSDFNRAFDLTQQSIQLSYENKDTNLAEITQCNIAAIYMQMGDFKNALTGFKKLLVTAKRIKNEKIICMSEINIASAYLELGLNDSVFSYVQKAIEYGENNNDVEESGKGYLIIASAYFKKKEYDSAEVYYNKALTMSETYQLPEVDIMARGGMAQINLAKGNYSEAEKLENQAITFCEKYNATSYMIEGYRILNEIYQKQNRFKEALEAYKNHVQLKDSFAEDTRKSEIIRKDLNYNYEKEKAIEKVKRDNEHAQQEQQQKFYLFSAIGILIASVIIFIFYKRNRDVKQKEKETALTLKISDTELKALRSQMNPHFLNNAFISIQEFVRENKPDEAEKYLLRFSKLMRAVLEASEKKEIPLANDLEILEWYMQFENLRMEFPFAYQFMVDKNIDSENTFVPPMILQPLVENAIKHGLMPKQSAGKITIIIEQKNDVIHAIVEDDGVGRDLNKKVEGPMLKNRQSMGMKITRDRLNILNAMKNINAELKIIDLTKDNLPIGTRVELTLPYQA